MKKTTPQICDPCADPDFAMTEARAFFEEAARQLGVPLDGGIPAGLLPCMADEPAAMLRDIANLEDLRRGLAVALVHKLVTLTRAKRCLCAECQHIIKACETYGQLTGTIRRARVYLENQGGGDV